MIQEYINAAAEVLELPASIITYDTDVDPKDGAAAYCDYDGDEVTISVNPSYLDHENLIEIIAHEMIHAQQYLSGALVNVSHLVTLWGDEEYINSSAYHFLTEAERHEMYINQALGKKKRIRVKQK